MCTDGLLRADSEKWSVLIPLWSEVVPFEIGVASLNLGYVGGVVRAKGGEDRWNT
jgi:hypothetical protein